MIFLVLLLIGIGVVAALFGFFASKSGDHHEEVALPAHSCAACEGIDTRCEQVCMMEAATKEIEYFNDEELDCYQGRAADAYTDEEVKEFAEVLETMRQEEVKDWNRSLILRGINLPNQLKDEVIMLMSNS